MLAFWLMIKIESWWSGKLLLDSIKNASNDALETVIFEALLCLGVWMLAVMFAEKIRYKKGLFLLDVMRHKFKIHWVREIGESRHWWKELVCFVSFFFNVSEEILICLVCNFAYYVNFILSDEWFIVALSIDMDQIGLGCRSMF